MRFFKRSRTKLKKVKYKRPRALNALLDTCDSHQNLLNIQAEKTALSESKIHQMQEMTHETRTSISEFAQVVKSLHKRVKSNKYIFYAVIVMMCIFLIFSLIFTLSIKYLNHKNALLATQASINSNTNAKSIINNQNGIEESKSSFNLEQIKQKQNYEFDGIETTNSYEYDYCTDYPLNNYERSYYYVESLVLVLLTSIIFLITLFSNRKCSILLNQLISKNFQLKYEICHEEIKLFYIIESIMLS